MTHAHRLLLRWARTIHVYLTLFGLLILLFFAVTGFMLNHEEWFGPDKPQPRTTTGMIPARLLQPLNKLAVVERLRADLGASGALVGEDFEEEGNDILVKFKGPGRRMTATIKPDGEVTLVGEYDGLIALLTDLHRGNKIAGPGWGLLVDGVCVLILIIAVTGLILWSSLRSRGRFGLAVIGLGLCVCVAVYWRLVP